MKCPSRDLTQSTAPPLVKISDPAEPQYVTIVFEDALISWDDVLNFNVMVMEDALASPTAFTANMVTIGGPDDRGGAPGDHGVGVDGDNNATAVTASRPIVVGPNTSSTAVAAMASSGSRQRRLDDDEEGGIGGTTEEDTGSSSPSPPNRISLQVREPTPSRDDDVNLEEEAEIEDAEEEEDIEVDDETTVYPGVTVPPSSNLRTAFPHVPRRERSHSTVSNPYLDIAAPPDAKVKRRSISTCTPLSISPPVNVSTTNVLSRLAVPTDDDMVGGGAAAASAGSAGAAATEAVAKPPLFGSGAVRLRESRYHSHHHHPRHSAHVRFSSNVEEAAGKYGSSAAVGGEQTQPDSSSSSSSGGGGGGVTKRGSSAHGGRRCHHMIAEEALKSGGSGDWRGASEAAVARKAAAAAAKAEKAAEGSTVEGGEKTSPHAVQRTQSNPEMECCPVCLARKECEILLKRTYSKVSLYFALLLFSYFIIMAAPAFLVGGGVWRF